MLDSICQSCGMPLNDTAQYGTDENGLKIEDYCHYCFKDGMFTSDVTMEEMIEICAKYVSHTDKESAIREMRIVYPTLKRWAQKEETQNEYHKSISKVLDYINNHLSENPDLETLAGIANISGFHFHRIFKAVIGEKPGEYIQRRRLEYVAEKLRTSDLTLDILADDTGYNSPQSLSKAFKKYFGMPPSVYKLTKGEYKKESLPLLSPRICKIANKHVLHVRTSEKQDTPEAYSTTWQKLYTYCILNKQFTESSESLGISLNYISENNVGETRFYACISIKDRFEPSGIFEYKIIEGGLYAIFVHKGAYEGLHDLYKNIRFGWLPSSNYKIRKGIFFEKYLNNPATIKEEDILTEVYVPVKEK